MTAIASDLILDATKLYAQTFCARCVFVHQSSQSLQINCRMDLRELSIESKLRSLGLCHPIVIIIWEVTSFGPLGKPSCSCQRSQRNRYPVACVVLRSKMFFLVHP